MKEKKSILVFYGSPHKHGYTHVVLDYFMTKLAQNYVINVVDCYKKNVSPCIDCGYCKAGNGCIYKDMDDIHTYLKQADILVFASPVYNFSLPSPLKAVIDRMQRYFNERFFLKKIPPIDKHKKAVILLTCGEDEVTGKEIIEKQLKKVFTIINTSLTASILWKGTDYLKDTKIDILTKEKINKVTIELKTK